MAYDLVDVIELPVDEGFPEYILKGYIQPAFDMAITTVPYKTGHLMNSIGWDLNGDEVTVYVQGCDYAVYLQEDIVKTAGWWDEFLAIFESALLSALEGDMEGLTEVFNYAQDIIQGNQYGLVYKTKEASGKSPYINMGRM